MALDRLRVRCITAVRRHNALGCAYFAAVRPFHRRLVPYLLTRAAQREWTPVIGPKGERAASTHGGALRKPHRG